MDSAHSTTLYPQLYVMTYLHGAMPTHMACMPQFTIIIFIFYYLFSYFRINIVGEETCTCPCVLVLPHTDRMLCEKDGTMWLLATASAEPHEGAVFRRMGVKQAMQRLCAAGHLQQAYK